MSQRLVELKVEEKSNTTPIIAINNTDEGKIVQQYNSSEAVQKLLGHVQAILQVIDGDKFKQFLEISHSKRYVEYCRIYMSPAKFNGLLDALHAESDLRF